VPDFTLADEPEDVFNDNAGTETPENEGKE